MLGALGVWAGFPLADPIIGLLITLAIFGIVWQSARAVLTRMLDGVEPEHLDEIAHAAGHVPGVLRAHGIQARWLGHRLHAEMAVEIDDRIPVSEAQAIVAAVRDELFAHLPVLSQVSIRIEAAELPEAAAGHSRAQDGGHHHGRDQRHGHAPEPVEIEVALAAGRLAIVETPAGERMRFTVSRHAEGLSAQVVIDRPEGPETLELVPDPLDHHALQSRTAPAEPHQFDARLVLAAGERTVTLPFRMEEPVDEYLAGQAHRR